MATALKLPYAAIKVQSEEGDKWEAEAAVGERPDVVEVIPVRQEGREIERLEVAPRSGAAPEYSQINLSIAISQAACSSPSRLTMRSRMFRKGLTVEISRAVQMMAMSSTGLNS